MKKAKFSPSSVDVSAVLSSLGLSSTTVNPGVFDGKIWKSTSSSTVHHALNASTGEVLAHVSFGGKEDYERCVVNASEVR
jgi:hypothetical protein